MPNPLRDLLFSSARLEETASMLAHPPTPSDVLGVVVEIGLPDNAVIIAGYANGDARLLWDSGGAVVGDLYQFNEIATAAKALCSTAQSLLDHLPSQPDIPPLPQVDIVQVTALTPGGLYSSHAPGPDIITSTHPLKPLYAAAMVLYKEVQALNESTPAES
jgi:hypothetical protein